MITTCDARYHRLWERVKSCVTGNFKEANKYPTKRFATIYPMTARNENRAGERVWCDVQPSLHAKCLTLRVPLLRGVVLERFSAHYCFFKQEETQKKNAQLRQVDGQPPAPFSYPQELPSCIYINK